MVLFRLRSQKKRLTVHKIFDELHSHKITERNTYRQEHKHNEYIPDEETDYFNMTKKVSLTRTATYPFPFEEMTRQDAEEQQQVLVQETRFNNRSLWKDEDHIEQALRTPAKTKTEKTRSKSNIENVTIAIKGHYKNSYLTKQQEKLSQLLC